MVMQKGSCLVLINALSHPFCSKLLPTKSS